MIIWHPLFGLVAFIGVAGGVVAYMKMRSDVLVEDELDYDSDDTFEDLPDDPDLVELELPDDVPLEDIDLGNELNY